MSTSPYFAVSGMSLTINGARVALVQSFSVNCLTEREAKIIRLRYGLNGGQSMPQRDVAKCCGISRSYVSRIEKKALEKLRQVLGEDACPT